MRPAPADGAKRMAETEKTAHIRQIAGYAPF